MGNTTLPELLKSLGYNTNPTESVFSKQLEKERKMVGKSIEMEKVRERMKEFNLKERANVLRLPFAEAMHLLHYSSHTSEDKIRIMSIENQPITKADVLRIFTEELEFNFEKHILPELAKPSTLYMYPKPSEPKMQ